MRQTFTSFGAKQFLHDGRAIFNLVDRYIPGGSGAMATLYEGMQLLNLPVEDQSEGGPKCMTLKDASDRVFTDNSEARGVMEELGLDLITPQNARSILQRRVENNEDVEW